MKFFLFCFILITFSCSSKNETKLIIAAKNKTIDSLKVELNDCKLQAQIMADVLEEERIKNVKKK
ncbi:hypothetical protein BBH99_00185 [Chryseobacterium contaminans]|uniref:Lipoprotein n=1 Tax=Chryseobacterium contaminans TaxID=1423959 RepID=A0A1M6VM56_9FLAO|nr:hypothetical protein [Chryseobacterium contaminans]OCA80555.1 hypothetical protein BBH99_00185 [Chryseobacterium contaminans]SHK82431.1 hypothetical protein SAMN05444407_101270 [Chryseobacterium contaminans]